MGALGKLLAALCAGLLAACAAPSAPQANSAVLLAPALQTDAPALAASDGGAAFVWTGFDAQDVHLDARRWAGGTLTTPVILPLPPVHPLDLRLIAGENGALHLFWRDAAEDGDGNRLTSALLRLDLTVERGPVTVSGAATYGAAALADEMGGAWLVWSEGHPAEPRLMLSRVSARGLPAPPTAAGMQGKYPALAAWPDGPPVLVWEQAGQLWRARVTDAGLTEMAALTATVGRLPGDRLDMMWASRCGALLCVGWNVVRSNGSAESWLASGSVDAPFWAAPQRLEGLRWLTPQTQPSPDHPALRAAAQTADGLVILTVQDGQARAPSLIVPGVTLAGSPGLVETESGGLLAWADAGPDYANLFIEPVTLPAGDG